MIETEERHIAYMDRRYRGTDENGVDTYSEEYPVYCRTWSTLDGGEILCDNCEKELQKRYPQGWMYYPGDVCEHNRYTGGCGIDWMCQECEDGE